MAVDSYEILEDRPDEPKGVYRRGGRSYYARED
jgi:hypothetical protein